jgi:hypothetical protein
MTKIRGVDLKKIVFIIIFLSIVVIANDKINNELTTYSFSLLEIISLSTAIISICLGIFAIWLTLHLKQEADSMNKETKEMLMEIKIDARTVTNGVFGEMEKWGNLGRDILTSSSKTETHGGVHGSITNEVIKLNNSTEGN